MTTDNLRWDRLKRPNQQFATRLVGAIEGRGRFLGVAAAATAGVLALAALGAGYNHFIGMVANEQAAALHAEAANAALQDELGKLRNQLGTAKGRLAALSIEAQARQAQRTDTEKKLAATEATATSKGDRVAQLNHALDQSQRELHLTEAQHATLLARLSKAETDLAEEQSHKAQAQSTLDQSQKRMQQLQAERDKAAAERDALKALVAKLEQKTSMRQAPPEASAAAPAQAAATVPPPAAAPAQAATAVPPPAAAPVQAATAVPPAVAAPAQVAVAVPHETESRVVPQTQAQQAQAAPVVVTTRSGRSPVHEVERVLASAGVDVAHLFSQFGVSRGEGGPFVPAPHGAVPQSTVSPEKLAALQAMMKALPVSAPLTSYEIGSGFGARHDPINGRSSFHTGLDFDAPYDSPVYATAPGVVTYAGYRDDYGKIVEIDHGHGLTTRYAHLHQFTVSVGQRIAAHTQIGYLGSTGRATGPHVHYEVLVNGEPQDPEKFLELGRIVQVSQRR